MSPPRQPKPPVPPRDVRRKTGKVILGQLPEDVTDAIIREVARFCAETDYRRARKEVELEAQRRVAEKHAGRIEPSPDNKVTAKNKGRSK